MTHDPGTMGLMQYATEAPRRPVEPRPRHKPAPRLLTIGIASPAEAQRRILAIARGELQREPGEPKVWFASMDAFARAYTTENRVLLTIVRERAPQSVKELAEMVGREPPNVLRTLRSLEHRGLVNLEETDAQTLRPVVTFDILVIVDNLGVEDAPAAVRADVPAHA